MSKQNELVIPSEARTADGDFTFACKTTGGLFTIDVSAATATPSVVFTIQGVAPTTGTKTLILQSAAITAVGVTVLRVHPQLTAAANTIAKDILPMAININANHADTASITYSVLFDGSD